MAREFDNPFLAHVMGRVRHSRPPLDRRDVFFNRVERVRGGNYVEVWFLTGGCTWDAKGGCTMCNYGQGHRLSDDETVDAVRRALADIRVPVHELLVSPSGGMLDPHEVPPTARRRIYDLVCDFPAPGFMIETRAETVTDGAVAELVERVPGKRLAVELGLESASLWVQRFCVNKGSTPEDFTRAVSVLHARGVAAYANVSLGTAFLNPSEAVEDAVRTARWALDHGADTVVIFPLHVKPYTLLAELHRHGRYGSPSLWSLTEALRRLGPASQQRVEIAWYRSYYTDASKTSVSPDTCPACRERVVALLDRYRATQEPEAVEALHALECPCKARWREEMAHRPDAPLVRRVAETYAWLAGQFGLEDWWQRHGEALRLELYEAPPDMDAPVGAV